MTESLDVFRYISYLSSKWRWIAGSAAIAVFIAIAGSLLMPRQYTATARIYIEPPAGTDPRTAMAVSPVYLEALKTYEGFASSDSMFLQAAERFRLRSRFGPKPVETLKQHVLKVGIVRNTRILEISATLPDARAAHELALYLAQSTVALNRSASLESDRELTSNVEQQEQGAKARLETAERSWEKLISEEPVDDLNADVQSAAEARANLEEAVRNTELELADDANRLSHTSGEDTIEIRREQAGAAVRLKELRKQLDTLGIRNAARERLLAARTARREKVEEERKAAQSDLLAIEKQLRETRGESGYRGERLNIIDPGVVPERPSSPNVPLNAAAALLIGLLLPAVYLLLAVTYQDQRASGRRSAYRTVKVHGV